jgi:hypothetical protein
MRSGHAAPILGGLFMADASVAPTLETQIKDLSVQLGKAADAVKEQGEKATAEFKSLGDATKETKQKADEALVKHGEISERMTALEQTLPSVRTPAVKPRSSRSVRKQSIRMSSRRCLPRASRSRGALRMSTKAIISALGTDADGSVGALLLPDRQAGIIAPPQRTMTVRSLLTPGTTNKQLDRVRQGNRLHQQRRHGVGNRRHGQAVIRNQDGGGQLAGHDHRALGAGNQANPRSDAPMLRSYIDGRLRTASPIRKNCSS